MRLTTWNVLHRIHAVNWDETPIAAFDDETERVAGITHFVADELTRAFAVCLQEVSGDQLSSLRSIEGVTVFEHTYPRIPKLRRGSVSLKDPSEHLVVLARAAGRVVHAETFATDRGKGFLAVDFGELIVVSVHVSYGERREQQLTRVADFARGRSPKPVAVLGDYNVTSDVVGSLFRCAISEPSSAERHSRPVSHKAARTIDHIAVFGGTITSAEVLDARSLSDHHPVTATLALDIP